MEIMLSLQILDTDPESVDYRLIGTENQNYVFWKKAEEYPDGEKFKLEIKTDADMKIITEITIGSGIQTTELQIRDAFLAALFEASIVQQTDEADGIEHTHDTYKNSMEENPYDPKLIRVDTKPFSIEYVCKLISSNKLDLSPDFQREFVWTEITRKSRLIESIILRIPIPVFYLSQSEDGKFQVVDGIQRLTVINDFFNNKFRLKNLEYLKELEGKWFSAEGKAPNQSIPSLYSERIEQTQLFFNIIDPSTPERVKYDIFRRINTGGKTLNSQEIRNCLSNANTRQLLSDMVNLDSFIKATRGSISRTRMADKEMALRFVGFYLLDKEKIKFKYNGNMDEFLDLVTEVLNKMNVRARQIILDMFDNAMVNAFTLFGSNAFRKTTLINKALFLSWSRLLCSIDNENLCHIPSLRINAQKALKARIQEDDQYYKSISTATNDVWSIEKAYQTAKKILEESYID